MPEKVNNSRIESRRPNYMLRRTVAVAALGLAAVGIAKVGTETMDRYNGTDIPSANEAEKHPEKFDTYIVQPGDTADVIAQKYTTGNHDYRNNSQHILDQAHADGFDVLTAGDQISVPTTEPPKQK